MVVIGKVIEVTVNAEEVLRRIHLQQKTRAVVPIWLDAPCIDQKNTTEREQQIGLM